MSWIHWIIYTSKLLIDNPVIQWHTQEVDTGTSEKSLKNINFVFRDSLKNPSLRLQRFSEEYEIQK